MNEGDYYYWRNAYWQALEDPGESQRRPVYHPRVISPEELRGAVLSQLGIGQVMGSFAGRLIDGLVNL